MKKQIWLKTIQSALTVALLMATTLSFAQRGERRGGGGGNSGSRSYSAPRSYSGGGPSAQERSYSRPSSSQGYSRSATPRVQSYGNQGSARTYQRSTYDNRAMASNNRISSRGYNSVNGRGVNSVNGRGVNSVNTRSVNSVGGYRTAGGAYYRPVYNRPPVIYNGYRYYTHYSYSYHPYIPFYYGSFFHPFGFFSIGLSPYAYELGMGYPNYWYDQGTYYQPYTNGNQNGYKAVPAPQGAAVNNLPNGYATINVNGGTYYYYAGTFYINGDKGFEVVPAPPGAVVYDLPEGAKEVLINGTNYVKYNETWYLPVTLDGKNGYEVVDVEKDDNF